MFLSFHNGFFHPANLFFFPGKSINQLWPVLNLSSGKREKNSSVPFSNNFVVGQNFQRLNKKTFLERRPRDRNLTCLVWQWLITSPIVFIPAKAFPDFFSINGEKKQTLIENQFDPKSDWNEKHSFELFQRFLKELENSFNPILP